MIEFLEWESKFFGFKIGRINVEDIRHDAEKLDEFMRDNKFVLVQANVDVSQSDNIRILEMLSI